MRPLAKNLLKGSLIVIIFYFILKQILCNWEAIETHIHEFNWFRFVISIVLFLLGEFCFNVGWFKILNSNDSKVRFHFSNYYWTISGFGKYIPGRIWQFVGRLHLFNKLGLSKKEIISYSIIEQCYLLLSAFLLFYLLILLTYDMLFEKWPGLFTYSAFVLILGGFTFIHPRVLNACTRILSKFFEKAQFNFRMTYRDSLALLAYYGLGWISIGFGFSFLTNSLIGINPKIFLFLVGANAGAYFLGYIVVVAPAGLGVREGVLTYLLNFVFAKGIGAMFSVIARMWYIVGEIFYLGLSSLVVVSIRRKDKKLGGEGISKGNSSIDTV
ncbi:MAG: lysylphosphatidylglycerol synthase domain-containing protein [Candidatus Hodarchaeota archaeon]